ncbi:hypothetical protein NC652_013321 [Populus alba x Populus x berolinensis]|nr:hypothetical protein NC652_013321 [Populus alba x Populus x berolinensis]
MLPTTCLIQENAKTMQTAPRKMRKLCISKKLGRASSLQIPRTLCLTGHKYVDDALDHHLQIRRRKTGGGGEEGCHVNIELRLLTLYSEQMDHHHPTYHHIQCFQWQKNTLYYARLVM